MARSLHWRTLLSLALLLFGLYQLLGAGLIHAKAWLAPHLIERAWRDSRDAGGAPVKPWPWADTWPVARLQVPSLGITQYVLAGDSGNALAFGPGHTSASALPGVGGTTVIGGHRDTHFAFLQQLSPGAEVFLETPRGMRLAYEVSAVRIVDASREGLSLDAQRQTLQLVTCYPFDTLRVGGPLRYVVTALPLYSVGPGATEPDHILL